MRKAFICITAAILFALILAGCAMFEKDYTVISDYKAEIKAEDSKGDRITVKDITELNNAVLTVIEKFGTVSDTIVFDTDYVGEPNADMAEVCKQIRKNPMCAYCVESLSYELYKVPAYYESKIHVEFAESAESIENIIMLNYSSKLSDLIYSALLSGDNRLAVMINHCSYTDDDVKNIVYDLYYKSPLIVPKEPGVVVHMFSSSGNQKLFEINIDYGVTEEEFAEYKNYIEEFHKEFKLDSNSTDLEIVTYASAYIINSCSVSQLAADNSAYSALANGQATSKGLSLALISICKENNIECMLVSGQRNWKNHYWSIVKINDSYFHIDIERCIIDSIESGFLLNDENMWEMYRWNLPEYPSCNGEIKYNINDFIIPAEETEPLPETSQESDG